MAESKLTERTRSPRRDMGLRTFVQAGGRVVELFEGDRLVVGRGDSCDLVIQDGQASRRHLQIGQQHGRIELTDLESRNGVLVNGALVSGTQELHHGDVVTVGRTLLAIRRQRFTPSNKSATPPPPTASPDEPTRTTQTDGMHDLLEGAGWDALRSGDLAGAEASAHRLLTVVRAKNGPRGLWPQRAADLAIALSTATHDPVWIERALGLFAALRVVADAERSTVLANLAGELRPSSHSIRDYLTMAGRRAHPALVALDPDR